jgi:hypothetical protein
MAKRIDPDKIVDISRLESKVQALNKALADQKILNAYVTKLKDDLRAEIGDREVAQINGVTVLTYGKADDFAFAQWAQENPEQARECTTHQWVEQLDKDKARAMFSATLEPHRKRSLLVK